ncbi:MAG: CRTAC1 family protein, partial [Thermoanaerobaculia bacterium]
YRNELEIAADGSRRLRFTDVTAESGIVADGYGMGVAVGDYDNDGWPDLYVTTWGSPNQLWRNNGDLTFSQVTAAAGVGETRWSIAAVFCDYDRDGWLDLFVANYLDYTYSVHKECNNDLGMRDYCGPASYKPLPDVLYRNRGDGTFEEVSRVLGHSNKTGSGMGVVSGDFDRNGWLDLYVANDELPNHLWMNAGDGTFRDEALMAGAAVNAQGDAEAGMGVDAGDIDGDGDEDLFVVHLDQETNTLYLTVGGGIFEDRTNETRLGPPSWALTGFGAGFLDYDNDGRLDLFVANGAVQALRDLLLAGDPYPLHQKNQLYRNLGDGRFAETSASAGSVFQLSEVSRGAAFGDLDNDGDTDVVVHNNGAAARLLINQIGQSRDWLGLEIQTGEGRGRAALGAWVEAVLADGTTLGRRVRTEGSYASAHDPRVLFGLGGSAKPDRIRVTWPDGPTEEWPPPPTGRYTVLRQGTGSAVERAGR